ncbi:MULTISPECIES: response regulator [Actinoplanes]|uniref:response regulator transcription factor n=1 Tax=Actinoplanes TaxID=1865 RepID=UPI0006971620|nr:MULTISPECIES: response regulator [Actinoplanes]GLY04172.1 hypothetical protein Acsp01_45510 [Actinoplanes sp. NBRC 101535]
MPQSSGSTTTIAFSDAEDLGVMWRVEDWAVALQPPTVLIADDDENIREIIEFRLQALGYRTLVADNGRTALELAINEHPQLVVMDVSMPGLDGLTFCYELHSSPQTARIPVIMISGRGRPGDMDLGRTVGAEEYLVKPFSMTDLINRVERLLRHR